MRLSNFDPPFLLVIDIGSSSVRAALYDSRARLLPDTLVAAACTLRITADGGADVDPAELIARTEGVIDGVLERTPKWATPIVGAGLDTMVFTTCGIDALREPLTPLYTYADSRSRDDVRALARELDVPAYSQRTGCPLHSAYLPARLRWLRRTRPELMATVARFVDVGTLLYSRWFDRMVPASYSVASWSGLLDRHLLRWDADTLRSIDFGESVLPPLAEYSEPQRGLAPAYATRWPVLRDIPFFLAVGDGAAANVGSGCVTPRRMALTVGTTGALRIMLTGEPPPVPPGLWAYKVGGSETLLGGALNEGGNVFAWATSAFEVAETKQLEQTLEHLPPDGHGLTVLPFIAGERSPGWSIGARATIDGISGSTTGLQLLQASIEAVSYRIGLVARLMTPHLENPFQVVASGGAMSQSPYWVQLLADVLQQPVLLSDTDELTSRGTAILALRALRLWATLEDVPLDSGTSFEPDRDRAAIYQAATLRQQELYRMLIEGRPQGA